MKRFNHIPGMGEPERLPRLGKIHLGVKDVSAKSGKEFPKATDFFVCPPEVEAVYGAEPRELEVLLPHDDPHEIMPVAFKHYRANGLWCVGNGVEAERRGADGKFGPCPEPCPCKHLEKDCRLLGSLKFFLPKVGLGGVYQIDTSSRIGIDNVREGLQLIKTVTGRLHLVPAILKLQPVEVAPDGKKKTVHVLTLALPSFKALTELRGELGKIRGALAADPVRPLALPEGDDDLDPLETLPPARATEARVVFTDPGEDVVEVVEEEVKAPAPPAPAPLDLRITSLKNWIEPDPLDQYPSDRARNGCRETLKKAMEKGATDWDLLVGWLGTKGAIKRDHQTPLTVTEEEWAAIYPAVLGAKAGELK